MYLNALQDDKVKINIKAFRNRNDFIQKLRVVLQKDSGFEKDLDAIADVCFTGNVEHNIKAARKIFLDLKNGLDVVGISGFLKNLIQRVSDAQIDEIELLLPEDEIEVQYRPTAAAGFKWNLTTDVGSGSGVLLCACVCQRALLMG